MESAYSSPREIREELTLQVPGVTPGGVIAAIMARLFPQEGKNRYEWQPRPGHGYAVTPDGYRPIPD